MGLVSLGRHVPDAQQSLSLTTLGRHDRFTFGPFIPPVLGSFVEADSEIVIKVRARAELIPVVDVG